MAMVRRKGELLEFFREGEAPEETETESEREGIYAFRQRAGGGGLL
jgi:hypothetical protein